MIMTRISALSLLLIYTACNHSVTPPPVDPGFLVSKDNAANIKIMFTGFDRARITHQSDSSVKSREYKGVAVGTRDSTGYHELLSSGSTYEPSVDAFFFKFDFALSLDSTKAETAIVIRYYHAGSGFTDVDTVIKQYKYPYPNAELFVTNSIMIRPFGHFQDIVLLGNKFYFHPTGAEGLYEYDLSTKVTRTLVQYIAGDHLAGDSIFIFCDINHNSIRRYNLLSETIDLTIAVFPSSDLTALETYQGLLYAIQGGLLRRYTYAGTAVDSVSLPGYRYHLAMSDGILYSGYASIFIKRTQLASMSELPSVASPARNLEGIKIRDGRLYFCDFYKSIVGFVPLQDLK